MIHPLQARAIRDHYERGEHLYFAAERYDVEYEPLQEIVDQLDLRLPGKGFDFNAILSGDPLANDPVVIHCQQTINRLDDLYERAYTSLRQTQNSEALTTKKTTVNTPPDWANPSFHDGQFHFKASADGGSERMETTRQPHNHGIRWFELALKTLDRSMKVQITLSKRKEKLIQQLTRPKNASNQPEKEIPKPSSNGKANSRKPEPEEFSAYTSYRGYGGYSENGIDQELQPYDDGEHKDAVSNGHESGKHDSPISQSVSQGSPSIPTRSVSEGVLPIPTRSVSEGSSSIPTRSVSEGSVGNGKPTPFTPVRRFQPKDGLEDFHNDESRFLPHKFVNDLLAAKAAPTNSVDNDIASEPASGGRKSPESLVSEPPSKQQTTNSASQPSAPSASPRETEPPAFHQRE
jgi:hypothetical protein